MALDKCYKTELEREYRPDPASGYRPVEGRHISIHPPPCFGSEGRERSIEYHRILKEKYGVTGVHVGTLAHIDIALEAGFKCNEIIFWPPECNKVSCEEFIEALEMALEKCSGKLKYVFLDEPELTEEKEGVNGCNACNDDFLVGVRALLNSYGIHLVIGHYESGKRGIDWAARIADEVTQTSYHTWYSGDQTGFTDNMWYEVPLGWTTLTWSDIYEDHKSKFKRAWVHVGLESYAYDESFWSDAGEWWSRVGNLSFDNEEFYFLFEAASNYNLEEVNLYAWEYLFEGIPCEVQVELFWLMMDRIALAAATKGWLQYPKQIVSYKQHLYKCNIWPCESCDPDDPSMWNKV